MKRLLVKRLLGACLASLLLPSYITYQSKPANLRNCLTQLSFSYSQNLTKLFEEAFNTLYISLISSENCKKVKEFFWRSSSLAVASEAADNGKSSIDFSNNNFFFRQKELILTDDYRSAVGTGLKGFRKGGSSKFNVFNMCNLSNLMCNLSNLSTNLLLHLVFICFLVAFCLTPVFCLVLNLLLPYDFSYSWSVSAFYHRCSSEF